MMFVKSHMVQLQKLVKALQRLLKQIVVIVYKLYTAVQVLYVRHVWHLETDCVDMFEHLRLVIDWT